MKTLKFVLPALAFLFAIVAAFASGIKVKSGTEYIQLTGACTAITGSCNNSSSNFCKFNHESGLLQVYDTQSSSTTCVTTLRHSLNGGVLNP